PARAPVSEVLAGVARLLRVEARHRDVELVVDCAPGEAAAGLAAPRLKQVLLNLCLNALQAMPRGGRLTLRARVQGDAASIEVEDTGAGIAPDVLPRIFEMHFTTRAEGSGLGLAICRRLVEEVGGVIDVSTRVGRGTTFRILLPLASSLLLETTVA
ncbi:MAG: ATP-binding protein, partial [Candidatus Polarisedimenticolia bacterium]